MKKYLKFLLVFIILLNINSVVYASNQCFYMPGKNNKVVVPKGYSALCYYHKTGGNTNQDNYEQIALSFNINGLQISVADGDGNILNNFLSLDKDLKPSSYSTTNFNWDGLELNANSYFTSSVFDKDIKGCPNSIYWVSSKSDKYVGFSSKTSPNISIGKNGKYAVYEIWMDEDDQIIFTSDDSNNLDYIDIYDYPNSEYYNSHVSKCGDSIETVNKSEGYGSHNESTTDTKMETLKSCSYYFELDAPDNKCYATSIKFDFIKTTEYDKKTNISKSTLSVTSDFPGLSLVNIESAINLVKLDDTKTYSNLNDYLTYKNGKWSCAKKIYIWKDRSGSNTVFGESEYDAFETSYGKNQIAVSHDSNQGLCVYKPDSNENTKPDINFGDPVEVNCEGILGQELLDFLNKIFRWIQILAPIFVIIISGVDFAGAILQDDKDAIKKASNKFIKRLIIAVALFFIPLILSWLLDVFNTVVTDANSSTCGIGE